MRTLIHLSDLHLGRFDPATMRPLVDRVVELRPDLVIVSGDLTQRARRSQFLAARQFLDALPTPQVVVPGNHDIPLDDLVGRLFRPLSSYRRYITADLEPAYIDDEIAVLGVNTARSATFAGGRINREQIDRLQERLRPLGAGVVRVIVSHHPFDLPPEYSGRELVGRAPEAMRDFANHRVDLLLAGHLHVSHTGTTAARHRLGDYAALFAQAGTATSTRRRGEVNSFNVLRIAKLRIVVERFAWDERGGEFSRAETQSFVRTGPGWHRAEWNASSASDDPRGRS